MSAFITKYNSPHSIEELYEIYENDDYTSIEALLEDCSYGATDWSVHKDAQKGDTVYFCCGPASKEHMERICEEARSGDDEEFILYAEEIRELHEHYAGKLMAVGYVAGDPYVEDAYSELQHWKNPWYAEIAGLQFITEPIDIDTLGGIVTLQPHTVTLLTAEQEKQLEELVSGGAGADTDKEFAYNPVQLFNKYLELIFSSDALWNRFQIYVRSEFGSQRREDFFAFQRDPGCIQTWRMMLDNMGGGIRLSLFAAMAFELLSYQAAGHDLDEELMTALFKPIKPID